MSEHLARDLGTKLADDVSAAVRRVFALSDSGRDAEKIITPALIGLAVALAERAGGFDKPSTLLVVADVCDPTGARVMKVRAEMKIRGGAVRWRRLRSWIGR